MSRSFLVIGLVFVLGCNGDRPTAAVSGVVTFNGRPLADTRVVFQPVGTPENPNPGVSSVGTTDAAGRYTLTTRGPSPQVGAVVGRHHVEIGATPTVPLWYNGRTILRFEVTPAGNNDANFALTSQR